MGSKLLEKILKLAVKENASDVHFQVNYPPLLRIFGNLVEVKVPHLTDMDTKELAKEILQRYGINLEQRFTDYDTSYSIGGLGRFRVNIYKQRGSFGLVMRVIPMNIRTFESLNLPPILVQIAHLRRGLVLITGATGMGKSTTIAAIISEINQTRKSHVLTIEDPIEFAFAPGKSVITQREISSDVSDYAQGLKAALRQDPDVIMLGELRDAETVDTCLKAAETGHLVLSTLHTVDVQKTIGRLIGFFPTAEQGEARIRIAENLAAVVSLRLLINKVGTGRIPAVEIMRVTRTIQDCISSHDKTHLITKYVEESREFGMQSFDQHLVELFKEGQLHLEVAKQAASSPGNFERAITLD
ncbi:type IV pilus twitching motility protein PilT [candidate division CSSED10-310 bacterium]|uniref:Type IV pilus twitching motility protein PilT n=1 Tax=candidate division CSSED10-310 bacterium TaxID=2855610 RepID=A0ABV6YRS1_UNCC1